MIPVMRETYRCTFDPANSYKPLYTKVDEAYLDEDLVFGIVTNQSLGYIPPVTLTKADIATDSKHSIETYFFEPLSSANGVATCKDVETRVQKLRNLDFPLEDD